MATYPFWKLHGLGNDFVFFDAMEEEFELSTAEVAALWRSPYRHRRRRRDRSEAFFAQ